MARTCPKPHRSDRHPTRGPPPPQKGAEPHTFEIAKIKPMKTRDISPFMGYKWIDGL